MGLGVLLPTLQGCIHMFQDYKSSLLDFFLSQNISRLFSNLETQHDSHQHFLSETVGQSGCRVHQHWDGNPSSTLSLKDLNFLKPQFAFDLKECPKKTVGFFLEAPIHSEPWIPSSYRSIFPFYHLEYLQYRNYTMTVKFPREFKKSPWRSFYFGWFKKPQCQYDD